MISSGMIRVTDYIYETDVLRGHDEIRGIYEMLNERETRGYIAGSYAAWMQSTVEHWQPNDIDIFATSESNWQTVSDQIEAMGYTWLSYGDIVREFMAEGKKNVQIIKPAHDWKEFPIDVLNSFDITAAKSILVCATKTWSHVHAGGNEGKLLRINDPLRTLQRVMKYHKRGVHFDNTELAKLFFAWEEMNEEQKRMSCDLNLESYDQDYADYEFSFDDTFFTE